MGPRANRTPRLVPLTTGAPPGSTTLTKKALTGGALRKSAPRGGKTRPKGRGSRSCVGTRYLMSQKRPRVAKRQETCANCLKPRQYDAVFQSHDDQPARFAHHWRAAGTCGAGASGGAVTPAPFDPYQKAPRHERSIPRHPSHACRPLRRACRAPCHPFGIRDFDCRDLGRARGQEPGDLRHSDQVFVSIDMCQPVAASANSFFQARFHVLSCFSLAIAASISSNNS